VNQITREEAAALMQAATSDTFTRGILRTSFESVQVATLREAAPALASTVVALHDRLAELEATLAAERGDPAGALPGWYAIGQTWNRDGAAVDRCCVDGAPGWFFHLPSAVGAFGPHPTAREAMRAADAAVTPVVYGPGDSASMSEAMSEVDRD
jgi:hypothetical protein